MVFYWYILEGYWYSSWPLWPAGSNTLLTIFLDVKECLSTSVIHEVVWSMAGHRNQTIFVSSGDLSFGPFQPWFEEVIKMWALEVDTTHWEYVKTLISTVTTIIYVLNVLLLYSHDHHIRRATFLLRRKKGITCY